MALSSSGGDWGGTGALDDTGTGGGAKYCVNVPLQEGMDDSSYQLIFKPVLDKVLAVLSRSHSQFGPFSLEAYSLLPSCTSRMAQVRTEAVIG